MVLWTVPACVPHAEKEELENSFPARGTRAGTLAGRGRVRLRDAGGYGRWEVAGEKLSSASSRSEDAPYVACTMSPDQKWIILAVTIQREKMI